jgi:hypothetical protein
MKRILYIIFSVLFSSAVSAQFNPGDPDEPGNKYSLSLTGNPSQAGNVYGGGSYGKGKIVYLSAYANDGYTFNCWKNEDEILSTSPYFDFVMPGKSTVLTAVFTPKEPGEFNPGDPAEPNTGGNNDNADFYTLTVIKEPGQGGYLNESGNIRLKEGETAYLYVYSLSSGYELDGWYAKGELKSIQSHYSYTMGTANDTITVKFNYRPGNPDEPGASGNTEYILITNQSELEQYANIEEFPRSVRITGTDITSLHSLSKMKAVNGDLRIENTSLTSLEGLDNLSRITGKLMVLQNRLLTTMAGIYSWNDIYYVLIEGNPELIDLCSMFSYAGKGIQANGAIRENAYNPTFEEIANGYCRKNEDVFKVESGKVYRRLNQLHCVLQFSNEPYSYTSLSSLVTLKSNQETLALRSFEKNNLSVHLYFDLPSKTGTYALNVSNTFKDVYGRTLNQNGNFQPGEDEDYYETPLDFSAAELYVIDQAPLNGTIGNTGTTDFYFNATLSANITPAQLAITSPSGQNVPIHSVSYLENTVPSRYRVEYAPLTEDGDYKFILSSADVKSTDGKTMNFDYEATIELPSVNFTPASVAFHSLEWTSGDIQELSYKVKNAGSKAVSGKWVDVIYLSSTNEWNMNAIELYRDTITATVNSDGIYENTIAVTAPTVVDGEYYILIKSNVNQSVKESTYTDNLFAAADRITASVVELSDANRSFTLERGKSKLFKVPVTDGKNFEIKDSEGIANLYMGYYSFPNTEQAGRTGNISILNADRQINYYLLVANNPKSTIKEQQCRLSIREYDLEIAGIFADTIMRYPSVLIPVEVLGCNELPEFALVDKNGKQYESTAMHVFSETLFYAQFQTDTLNAGSYGLYVSSGEQVGLKENAVYIKEETPRESLETKIILPSTSRIGTTIIAYVEYVNTGNVDIPAPLLILSGTGGSTYQVGESEIYKDEIHLMGLNAMGVLNRLRPGEGGRIAVQIGLPNQPINTADYKLRVLSNNAEDMNAPFYLQWLDVDPAIKPASSTQEEWNGYVARLRKLTGETWGSFVEGLNEIEGYLMNSNIATVEAKELYGYLKDFASLEDSETSLRQRDLRISHAAEDVEPGTIFIWGTQQNWIPLVKYENGIWNRIENACALFDPGKRTFFVSHGWNDDRFGNAAWYIAIALSTKYPLQCNIITVDWSKWSNTGYFGFTPKNNLPLGLFTPSSLLITRIPIIGPAINSGYPIPLVAQRVYKNMCLAIMGSESLKCTINKFHLIGHSHGAHVCGMLAEEFTHFGNKPDRLTCLDASTDFVHINPNNLGGGGWDSESANYVDYYKSSVLSGSESLKGQDNFILIEKDKGFDFNTLTLVNPLDLGFDAYRHAYAITWYIETILNSSIPLGFNFEKKSLNELWGKNGKPGNQWHGVINGSRNTIENLSIRDKLNVESSKWNYTAPWYTEKKGLLSDKDFRDALAGTFELTVNNEESIFVPENELKVGSGKQIDIYIENRADNHTIPHNARDNQLYSKIRHNLFLVPEGTLPVKTTKPILQLRGIVDPKDTRHYYPTINITEETWKTIGGNDNIDHIDCDLILKTGMDADESKDPANDYWKGELYTENNTAKVKIRVTKSDIKCDAGVDIVREDRDNDGVESIYREGKASSKRGEIKGYGWYWDGKMLSAESILRYDFPVGTHTVTFHVSDGVETATDEVIIEIKPYTPSGDEGGDASTTTIGAWDPNEKVGVKGAGDKDCILPGNTMDYTIFFENDPEKANAPAQEVRVTDVLDEAFDLSTFSFTGAKVANREIVVPNNVAHASVITDLRPENNLLLQTTLNLDIDTRTVSAIFTSLDPETGEFTLDPWAGFLFPNDETHRGEGSFSYRTNLKENIADAYEINNQAMIYFDWNDPIATNITSHAIDLQAPSSNISDLPASTEKDSVLVSWTGSDRGSGVKSYDIYVSDNGGKYVRWKEHAMETSSYFRGETTHSYSFFSIATDFIGHVESMKSQAESSIQFRKETGLPEIIKKTYPLMVVSPNPVHAGESCHVLFNVPEEELDKFHLVIYSILGEKAVEIHRLKSQTRIENLHRGVYIIQLQDTHNANCQTQKVIVIN